MRPDQLFQRFASLSTAHLADACIRAAVPVRCGPAALQAVLPGSQLAGRAFPARHASSVDVFLEALERAAPGDVLVVDNTGRPDEACVGDLIVREAQAAGLSGIVNWSLHRDTAELRTIGLLVFSLGALPTGPLRVEPQDLQALESAFVGEWTISGEDVVVGDEDGVLFLPAAQVENLLTRAEGIRDAEHRQAERIRTGISLRTQLRFQEYLAPRQLTTSLTFRQHLRMVGGAIEE